MLRFQWHEVEGPRRISKTFKSKVVLEAAAYLYARFYLPFHQRYTSKMSQEVMIVCPFAETLEWWDRVIEEHLSIENAVRAKKNEMLLTRNHHSRLLSNSADKDIQSTVVIVDPANQDGTKFGQGFFKQEMVEIAISRATDVVIFIGNSCQPITDGYYTPREVRYTEMKSTLNAAHGYARFNEGLIELKNYKLDEPLVFLADIPETLLLDTELKAYAKLRNSSDWTSGDETPTEGRDGVKVPQSGSEEIEKLADLTLSSLGEGGAEKGAVAEDAN